MPRRRKLISFRKPRVRLTKKGVRIQPPSARIGRKLGLNLSKSGISGSVRTGRGSYNTRRGCSFGCLTLPVFTLILFFAWTVLEAIPVR